MKELNDIESIIIRSLDRTASETELAVLKEWLHNSDENKTLYFQIKDVWDSTADNQMPSETLAWKQLQSKLPSKSILPLWAKELVKVAAVAVLVAITTYAIFEMPETVQKNPSYATVIVPNGSQTTVELADGTTVRLNSGSELSYPSVFGEELREVTLKGEGYFSVKHDNEHPFVVSTNDLEVRVLGTEFNVMAYDDADYIETTLVKGSVSLNKKGASYRNGVILKPGQKAIYQNGQLAINKANVELVTNWMKKGLYFQRTSLKELAQRLERWYDVDIILSNEMDDLTFTGKFRNNETIWQILDVIKMTTPIDYKVKEDKIYITQINE
ncbi:FecR family protein [Carboxylicivirga marina]|uniref:FecR family protein n=1 Tax=Carboxylicivirga marina TaxID=2800988 RepID=UPI002595FEBE|nr:FecR domain-containing protein [uncultured Carboxylicivirga sp.]